MQAGAATNTPRQPTAKAPRVGGSPAMPPVTRTYLDSMRECNAINLCMRNLVLLLDVA